MLNITLYNSFASFCDEMDSDDCGSPTFAILTIGHTKVPLCEECFDELLRDMKEIRKTVHCYECKHYGPSKYGFTKYGGSCLHEAKRNGVDNLAEDEYGYVYMRDYTDTCDFAERKEDNKIENEEHE